MLVKILSGLLLATIGIPATAFAQAASSDQLFLPTTESSLVQNSSTQQKPGYHARRFNAAALRMRPRDEIGMTLPNGEKHVIVFDRKERHANGDETWIGHPEDDPSGGQRVVITTGKSSIVGKIRTSTGEYFLSTENGRQWLIDPVEAGHKAMRIDSGGMPIAPQNVLRTPEPYRDRAQRGSEPASATAVSTIDVAVLYSPSMVSIMGSADAVQTRINYLIALSNLAYLDSGIAMNLRLVHSEPINFPDGRNLDEALEALSASENPYNAFASDPAMSGVKLLRDTYGADLVSFIRPFNTMRDDYCGLAWLGGSGGNAAYMSNYAAYGYSAINDGVDISGSLYYCSDYTLAHELGHNMGSQHDIAHANGSVGAFPYSYGHGIDNVFGTIMSYFGPTVGKFSSPLLTCNGYRCGVSGQADNVFSINSLRTAVASFRAAAPTIQSGWWWNAAEPGRGYFIETRGGRFFTGSFLYDDLGHPIWYVTGPASVSGNRLPGTLEVYAGGQTLTGAYTHPAGPTSAGFMSIDFADSSHGTISWPGGSVPITRYEIGIGSLTQPSPNFKPETGWWWNANEGGRGFSIEVQGKHIFVAGFMYDDEGNPTWYVSGGEMTTDKYYQGTWQRCANGQSMTGWFKTATCGNLANGSLAINFTSTTTALMRLPDGRTLDLVRYSF